MSTLASHSLIASTLFGKTRRRILGLLFTNADKKFYVREIIRLVDCGQSTVQGELVKLESAGLIKMEIVGRHTFFSANKSSPVYPELHMLMVKTYGIGDILRGGLENASAKINFAFIFGSFASGKDHSESDIDLLVIGESGSLEINKSLRDAKTQLMREVNLVNYSLRGFKSELKNSPFLQSVINEPKIMLIGDENEFKLLG